MICNIPTGYQVPFTGHSHPLPVKGDIPLEAYVYMGHHDNKHVIPDTTNDKTGRILNILA